jgi:hypothetical protein
MSSSHEPISSSPPEAPQTPMCSICGKPMRLNAVEPNPHYTNLDLWSYTCECGESANNFVAHRPNTAS